MLEINNLHYSTADFWLQIDAAIPPASRLAVIGPSGGGKSTLLTMIGGFLAPNNGRLSWQGQDFTKSDPGLRPIASLFQAHNLFPHLSLAKNIGLALNPTGSLNSDEKSSVFNIMQQMQIDALSHRLPREVSGGQAQRAAICRLVLQNKPITLLDEPFAALGPRQRITLRDIVTQLTGGDTRLIILVSHQMEDIRDWATHIMWVENGAHVGLSNAADFFDNPPESAADYLGL